MKTISLFICIYAIVLVAMGDIAPSYHVGRVTVSVVDEQGTPVASATACIGFSKDVPAGEGWGTRPFSITGQTDTNGMFTAEAKGNPSGSCSARKEGYYPTMGIDFMFTNVVLGHWQPWNPTIKIVLRKIGNPVPMYAKRVEIFIPALNVPLEYDLIKGDWVIPHGQGMVCDLIFEVDRRFTSQDDYEAVLTVSTFRQGDGFQIAARPAPLGSALRLSCGVPFISYHTNIIVKWGRDPNAGGMYGNTGDDYNPNYFLRVRSELDDKGNVAHALYGKVHGAFRVSGVLREKAKLSFTYYLNPDGSRNVEFNPNSNLFTNLRSTERVTDP